MSACDQMKTCGFYLCFKDSDQSEIQDVIHRYCYSQKNENCARKRFQREHGEPPPEEMSPGGNFVR